MTRGDRARRVVLRAGAALVVWVAVLLCADWFGTRPEAGLLALCVVALGVTGWLFLDVFDALGDPAPGPPAAVEPLHPRGADGRHAALTRLVAGHLDARTTAGDALQRQLMTLVDQRLVARHGLSWRADPGRAAPLLPPELLALAQQSAPYPRMSARQIDVLLSRIEAL